MLWPTAGSYGRGRARPSAGGINATSQRASAGSCCARGAVASPLFPPQHKTAEEAKLRLVHTIGQAPEHFGLERTRWRLDDIGEVIEWLKDSSRSGVWRCLAKFKIRLKRGQHHLHSPDPDYEAKLEAVVSALSQALASEGKIVVLFLDELTFYRQPSLDRAWAVAGKLQPLAHRSLRSDTSSRVVGALEACRGALESLQAGRISIPTLVKFLAQIRAAFPEAERIYLVVDNWPVHYHADVLAALEPQTTRFPMPVPASWPTEPSPKAKRLNLPIQYLPLPTYAPWCNPIEKVWRLLKQDVLHLHRKADDWKGLKQQVDQFLLALKGGSQDLLRYVGLTEKSKLYGPTLAGAP
jgi:transposase